MLADHFVLHFSNPVAMILANPILIGVFVWFVLRDKLAERREARRPGCRFCAGGRKPGAPDHWPDCPLTARLSSDALQNRDVRPGEKEGW